MAQCATEPQVHAGLPREDSEERAAWEVSDEEEAEKRVQVVYKKGRQRRKGAVGAVQVKKASLCIPQSCSIEARSPQSVISCSIQTQSSIHGTNGTGDQQENGVVNEDMPEWPDGGADNVASVAVIEGNIAQALGHLDNMNASCRQPRKGLSTGIGTADISNIAHTLTMTPMQASKKGLELPWRSQQPFKSAASQAKGIVARSVQKRSWHEHHNLKKSWSLGDYQTSQSSHKHLKLQGRAVIKRPKLITTSEQLLRLAGLHQQSSNKSPGRGPSRSLCYTASTEKAVIVHQQADAKDDAIASDSDGELPARDVCNRGDGPSKHHELACQIETVGDHSEVNQPASKLPLCSPKSAQTTAISSTSDIHDEPLITKLPSDKPAQCGQGAVGVEAQRTFLSRIYQQVKQSSWSSQSLSGRGQNSKKFGAGLAGRLQQITCTEKAQRDEFNSMSDAEKNGLPHFDVRIVRIKWDGHLVSALCDVENVSGVTSKLSSQITAVLHSKTCGVETAPGTKLRVYDPWTSIRMKDTKIDVVLCFFVSEL